MALVALVLLGASVTVAALFRRDVARSERRVSEGSNVIKGRFGTLEFAMSGAGQPLLIIHGTGGGFDQGLSFTQKLSRRGYQSIAPSRFGYLRSDYPDEPSSEHQADALVDLLDHLGIERLPVAGGSAGALSAVQFALRHPERCSALILVVPAANVRGRDPVKMSAVQETAVRRLSNSDFLFWAASNLQKKRLIRTLLATNPDLLEAAPPEERRRVHRILDEIMPVRRRSRGLLNDAALAGNPARVDFSKITVPTLVVSVEDDGFGTAQTARHIAREVPGSELVIFETGGHVWVNHDEDLWRAVAEFLEGSLGSPRRTSGRQRSIPATD